MDMCPLLGRPLLYASECSGAILAADRDGLAVCRACPAGAELMASVPDWREACERVSRRAPARPVVSAPDAVAEAAIEASEPARSGLAPGAGPEEILAAALLSLEGDAEDGVLGVSHICAAHNELAGPLGFVGLTPSHFSRFLAHVGLVPRKVRIFRGKRCVMGVEWDAAREWAEGRAG